MIHHEQSSKIRLILYIVGAILLFDIFTIITNIYIAPVLDGYGLPDILIYIKAIISLSLFILLVVWLSNPDMKLPRLTLKMLLVSMLAVIALYVLSLFLYKYVLLLDTISIIKNKILNGNPATILDFSGINYRTLTYVSTIYAGFNSEIILFFEALTIQYLAMKINQLEIEPEGLHKYDTFLFDRSLFWFYFFFVLGSFLSINIVTFRFDLLGLLEIGLALFIFIIVFPGIVPAFRIAKWGDQEVTRSFFIGSYRLIWIVTLISSICLLGLFGLNIAFIGLGRETYRVVSSGVTFILSIIIFTRVHRILSLENKE